MKKTLFLLSVLILAAQPAHANGLGDFFDRLKNKIEQLVPQQRLSATTAAGGVRGAAVETSDVYWKGEAKPVDADELAAFRDAMALAESGKKAEAAAAFAAFSRAHPDSVLRKDADEAVKVLQAR
jgi:TolA-binding protein